MKLRMIFGLLLIALILASCSLFETSAEDRLNLFLEDVVAENWDTIYENFDKNETTQYNTIKSSTYWTSSNWGDMNSSAMANKSVTEISGETVISGDLTFNSIVYTVTFYLSYVEFEGYYIREINHPNDGEDIN
jgi:hypothetical protein